MVPELGRRVTALLALRAGELLPDEPSHHLRVHGLQVSFQMPMSGEALEAEGAVVGPLSSVSPPVQPQLPLTRKPVVTTYV